MKSFVGMVPVVALLALSGCGSEDAAKAVVTSTDTCHIDFINGSSDRLVQFKPGKIDVRGWAFDKNTFTTPENIELLLKDTNGQSTTFDGAKRGERPDVAKAYSQEKILNAGFLLKADASTLSPGIYGIALKMSEGQRVVLCDIKKNLKVE